MRSTSGMTLFELLVTTVIIAVLIGILLPAIRLVKDSAHAVKCSSNGRQMYTAMSSYSVDWKGNFPYAALNFYRPEGWLDQLVWLDAITPYANNGEDTNSLADRSSYSAKNHTSIFNACPNYQQNADATAWERGYAMNVAPWLPDSDTLGSPRWGWGATNVWPVLHLKNPSLRTVTSPAQRPLIGESENSSELPASWWMRDFPTRHHGSANYVYFDGHVSRSEPRAAADSMRVP